MEEGDHVLLQMDSTVAVSFINRKGGTRSAPLRDKALEIWKMILNKRGWVTARWIPREENQMADLLSKENMKTWEFGLDQTQVDKIKGQWGSPAMDLFASNRFHIVEKYCSLERDPKAYQIDAFNLSKWPQWSYAFPPIPLVNVTLDRIKKDQIKIIMVVPMWTKALINFVI